MDQSDIDDCGKDGHYDVDVGGTHASAEVERDADDGHNTDAAAEADAAAARPGN
jgi:hypothetical protein